MIYVHTIMHDAYILCMCPSFVLCGKYCICIGELCVSESKRRLVQAEVWAILNQHFPTAREFLALHAVCQQCMVSKNKILVLVSDNKFMTHKCTVCN